ncbi:hypothetical protein JHJ32_04380 [Parapedobacter sp. ISTM3]|uniref:hypothetical protein n=1 Tax=Parapedobacter sp. ISTM3 TaxID=2800130 RepID=UPI001906384E|nr:hypothetical protein [Parapedobacter sp. ISTM3]MBK1439215.1 hypothetical protein [Parapedobacter sp. ISTM3]
MMVTSSCDTSPKAITPAPQDSVVTGTPPPNNGGLPEPDGPAVYLGQANNEELIIDGQKQDFDCHSTIYIKGGNYRSIDIRNLERSAGCPLTITNQGRITLAGKNAELRISNASHVTVTGDVTNGNEKGFNFLDNSYRALILSGRIHHVTLSNMAFKNISDYVISYNNQTVFDGSDQTATKSLRILKMDCEASGPFINFSGRKEGSTVIGLYKELEIAHVNYYNSPSPGIIVFVPNAEAFNIHHNTINNVNTQNEHHNAMFQIHGNGQFHNNYISNHQGNALRSRPFSFGNTVKEVLIYNNIVINSRKYSAFEVQTFAEDLIHSANTVANVKVFNNTCGNLNLSSDWYGVVLDAYTISGGKCDVFNNLAFNLPAPHPKSPIVSYMAINTDDLTDHSNFYYESAAAAGIIDETTLRLSSQSPNKNKGIKVTGLTTDYYGISRDSERPSVGAVE